MLLLPCASICAVQSTLCMLSFFTIFWWYGVPLSAVYNHGTDYWMNPNSGNNLSFNCWWVRMRGCSGTKVSLFLWAGKAHICCVLALWHPEWVAVPMQVEAHITCPAWSGVLQEARWFHSGCVPGADTPAAG